MTNRDLIRTKVVQLVYAYYQRGGNVIAETEKELDESLTKAYDLYQEMLLLPVAITHEAGRRLEVAQAKARRAGEEEPSTKFVYNKFALQLEANDALADFIDCKGNIWADERDYVRRLTDQITSSPMYAEYMAKTDDSYEDDRELWRKIYRTLIQENPDIDDLLEEKSIYWNDDRDIVDTFVLKTIKRFDEKSGRRQDLLPEYDDDEGEEYAHRLLRAAIMKGDTYQKYMQEVSRDNWEFGRLAFMDVVIMQIAIAEMMTFPSIPIAVTINEYVDLAKLYSTPRSGGYVNGMLDAIAHLVVDRGELIKAWGAGGK